jgi:hypothetical protein
MNKDKRPQANAKACLSWWQKQPVDNPQEPVVHPAAHLDGTTSGQGDGAWGQNIQNSQSNS